MSAPAELLGPEEWHTFRQWGRPRSFERGEVLFLEGDPGHSVLALESGRVKVLVQSVPGRELLLAVKGPGELLGEMSAIDGRPRSATAISLEPGVALVMAAAVFGDFLEAHPRTALRLLKALASGLRGADRLIAEHDGGDIVTRTARRLVDLATRYGEHSAGETRVGLALTQDDLAGWIGATREATSRALGQLRAAGYITTGRRRITVVDLAGLRRYL